MTISASVLTACSGSDSTGVFGASGTGGTGGDTSTQSATNAGSGGTGGAGGMGMSGAGGMGTGGGGGSSIVCDDIGVCQDFTDPMAVTCIACAREGDCADELAVCLADPTCSSYYMCLKACPPNDQVCYQNCNMTYMAALAIYDLFQKCAVCDNCRNSCAQFVQPLMCPPAP